MWSAIVMTWILKGYLLKSKLATLVGPSSSERLLYISGIKIKHNLSYVQCYIRVGTQVTRYHFVVIEDMSLLVHLAQLHLCFKEFRMYQVALHSRKPCGLPATQRKIYALLCWLNFKNHSGKIYFKN